MKLALDGSTYFDAMVAVKLDNPCLTGVLPKGYVRPVLDKQRLGELFDVIATIEKTHGSVAGGQFYTASCVVRCLVEALSPARAASPTAHAAPTACSCRRRSFVESHA